MIFNRFFSQENSRQREVLSDLREDVIKSFQEYRIAWNVNAEQINDITGRVDDPAYAGLTLLTLGKNIQLNTVTDCVDEINTAISDAETKLDRLVEDGIKPRLISVEWKGKKRTIDHIEVGTGQKVGKIITNIITITTALATVLWVIAVSVFAAGFFAFITFFFLPEEEIQQIIYIGVLAGVIAGSFDFVILDLFFSAIHGIIERKALHKAVDTLTKLKESMDLALPNAIVILAGIASSLTEKFDHRVAIHDASDLPVLEEEKSCSKISECM